MCARTMADSVHVKDKIDVTNEEEEVFQLLLNVLQHSNLDTQLRVAGGWVRDKLLGTDCHDMDIMVDNMLGREFCEKINEYLLHVGGRTHRIVVVRSNHNQFKHLETAMMRLFGKWIDFVNLRKVGVRSYERPSRQDGLFVTSERIHNPPGPGPSSPPTLASRIVAASFPTPKRKMSFPTPKRKTSLPAPSSPLLPPSRAASSGAGVSQPSRPTSPTVGRTPSSHRTDSEEEIVVWHSPSKISSFSASSRNQLLILEEKSDFTSAGGRRNVWRWKNSKMLGRVEIQKTSLERPEEAAFSLLASERVGGVVNSSCKKFGTAEEDAYLRDLTINSMFYNLNTNSVEDLTGRGVADLKSGVIVTPLPPKATFLDDPLRVLRAIRFSARFGFVLDEELQKAADDEEVKAALANKISRQRIGHEIDLMVSGNRPNNAIGFICELQLFWVVFSLPQNSEPAVVEGCDRQCVAYMNAAWDVLRQIGFSIFSAEQCRLYLYGALFIPLRQTVYTDSKGKKVPVAYNIFLNSLKLKAKDGATVINLHNTCKGFVSLIPFMTSSKDSIGVGTELEEENLSVSLPLRQRILAGLLLRQIKDFWRVALLMSTLLPINNDHTEEFLREHSKLEENIDTFKRVENSIIELDLDHVWNIEPLLDGKAIKNILQLKGPVRQLGKWTTRVLKWQLAHPKGTAEECIDWIKQS
ncbi:hypothetical protein MRB53_004763 [Persea americana]|uniref:Uncharacterized protein n=1 Tax=Persea americana TaxID=3435 RepID=A0ACC2MBG4_PERAE|nr:hypothetical protein MRB53_004763 [Persea americana]